jgi:hypothetical protein
MPGAVEFLDDYSWDLKRGLRQETRLNTDEKRRLLTKACEVLEVISREWDKCELVLGNDLRLAIVHKLKQDIRVALKG